LSKGKESSVLSSVKKCPICGGRLEKGYLNAPRGIYWSTEKPGVGTRVLDTALPRFSSWFMSENPPALRCENCGVAIVDYRAAGETPESFLKNCVKCGREIPIASEECSFCGAKQRE